RSESAQQNSCWSPLQIVEHEFLPCLRPSISCTDATMASASLQPTTGATARTPRIAASPNRRQRSNPSAERSARRRAIYAAAKKLSSAVTATRRADSRQSRPRVSRPRVSAVRVFRPAQSRQCDRPYAATISRREEFLHCRLVDDIDYHHFW